MQCYYCGRRAVTKEHVPPVQIFKGLPPGRPIKVPSCDEHNNGKSLSDRINIRGMLVSLDESSNRYKRSNNILTVIENTKRNFSEDRQFVFPTQVMENSDQRLAYVAGSLVDRSEWIRQLTAALVYDANRYFDSENEWDTAVDFNTNFLPRNDTAPISEIQVKYWAYIHKVREDLCFKDLVWRAGWWPNDGRSTNYRFNVYCDFENQKVIFHHSFLGNYNWYIRFNSSQGTQSNLIRKTQNRLLQQK